MSENRDKWGMINYTHIERAFNFLAFCRDQKAFPPELAQMEEGSSVGMIHKMRAVAKSSYFEGLSDWGLYSKYRMLEDCKDVLRELGSSID